MKTLKYFALVLFLVSFVACSSDDDSGKGGQNYFTYQDKTYELKAGIIEKDGTDWSDDGSMEYYISLTSSAIGFDSNNEAYPTENIFSIIGFNLFSKANTQPKTGTYTYNAEHNVDYTFDDAAAFLNVNWEEVVENDDIFGLGTVLFITSGTIELHKTGSIYKMDFEFTTHTNEIIKGHYEGELLVDFEDNLRPVGKSVLKNRE